MIRCKPYPLLLLLIICFVPACVPVVPCADAGMQRHMVIYGGLKAADLPQVARNADILVLDYIRRPLLKQLKAIKPDLILLKYQHGIGYHPTYPDWKTVDRQEDWFLHAAGTGQRLVERHFGWYLMDITAGPWKQFWADAIIRTTDPIYDGVFIDDCWNRFVPKFVGRDSKTPARPADSVFRDWSRNVSDLLVYLKKRYPGLVYINGAHPEYLPIVDGCMEEGFIHAGWQSDRHQPDADAVARALARITSLQSFAKPILLQSGSKGDEPAKLPAIFNFCKAAYLLVADRNTYFNFHPHPGYGYKGIWPDENPFDPGPPLGPMQMTEPVDLLPNLLPNPDFSRGLSPWRVLSGNPEAKTDPDANFKLISLESRSAASDRIISPLIAVDPNTNYALSVRSRARLNRSISAGYRKFGLQGRFFDRSQRQLSGAYDLQFDEGRFDWLCFGRTLKSPPAAAFFQIRIGFIDDGIGSGQVDKVRFAPAQAAAFVIDRRFSGAMVVLNAGSREATVKQDGEQTSGRTFLLAPGQAKIIKHQAP